MTLESCLSSWRAVLGTALPVLLTGACGGKVVLAAGADAGDGGIDAGADVWTVSDGAPVPESGVGSWCPPTACDLPLQCVHQWNQDYCSTWCNHSYETCSAGYQCLPVNYMCFKNTECKEATDCAPATVCLLPAGRCVPVCGVNLPPCPDGWTCDALLGACMGPGPDAGAID